MRVSFIGLGVMGYPMAGHLQKAGFEVTVFNHSGESGGVGETVWRTVC
ncbi:3-hydroxyisobutyrate dehydrogenase, putative [Vibrio cholerae]|nr:3-hydroxyisobutyrate dehydrogenase, putative [Vibrio cholerae]